MSYSDIKKVIYKSRENSVSNLDAHLVQFLSVQNETPYHIGVDLVATTPGNKISQFHLDLAKENGEGSPKIEFSNASSALFNGEYSDGYFKLFKETDAINKLDNYFIGFYTVGTNISTDPYESDFSKITSFFEEVLINNSPAVKILDKIEYAYDSADPYLTNPNKIVERFHYGTISNGIISGISTKTEIFYGSLNNFDIATKTVSLEKELSTAKEDIGTKTVFNVGTQVIASQTPISYTPYVEYYSTIVEQFLPAISFIVKSSIDIDRFKERFTEELKVAIENKIFPTNETISKITRNSTKIFNEKGGFKAGKPFAEIQIYDNSETYNDLDIVVNNGIYYESQVDENRAELSNITNWKNISYDSSKAYGSGDIVVYNNGIYVYTSETSASGKIPGTDPEWEQPDVSTGGAIGKHATATTGFAGGENATALNGAAIGEDAKATADGAVQLGSGTNDVQNTLKFRGTQLVANDKLHVVNDSILAGGDIDIGTNASDVDIEGSSIDLTGTTGITGNTTITGDIITTGSLSVDAKTTGKSIYLNSKDIRLSGYDSNNSVVAYADIKGTGVISLSGTKTNVYGSLEVNSSYTGQSISLSGPTTIAGDTSTTGSLTVNASGSGKSISLSGPTTINGTLNTKQNADFDANVNVDGTLNVNSASTLKATTIVGNASITGITTIAGDTSTTGSLTVNASGSGKSISLSGPISTAGSIVPASNSLYNLGSEQNKFNQLFVTDVIATNINVETPVDLHLAHRLNLKNTGSDTWEYFDGSIDKRLSAFYMTTYQHPTNASYTNYTIQDVYGAKTFKDQLTVDNNLIAKGAITLGTKADTSANPAVSDEKTTIKGTLDVESAATFDSTVDVSGILNVENIESENDFVISRKTGNDITSYIILEKGSNESDSIELFTEDASINMGPNTNNSGVSIMALNAKDGIVLSSNDGSVEISPDTNIYGSASISGSLTASASATLGTSTNKITINSQSGATEVLSNDLTLKNTANTNKVELKDNSNDPSLTITTPRLIVNAPASEITGETTFTGRTNIRGDIHISGSIIQSGSSVETEAEILRIKDQAITLRDGATSALGPAEYAGILAEKYDGTNTGGIVFDKDGVGRIGDLSVEWGSSTYNTRNEYNGKYLRSGTSPDYTYSLITAETTGITVGTTLAYYKKIVKNVNDDSQAIATREDNPNGFGSVYWNNSEKRFKTTAAGTSGYFLKSNGSGSAPEFSNSTSTDLFLSGSNWLGDYQNYNSTTSIFGNFYAASDAGQGDVALGNIEDTTEINGNQLILGAGTSTTLTSPTTTITGSLIVNATATNKAISLSGPTNINGALTTSGIFSVTATGQYEYIDLHGDTSIRGNLVNTTGTTTLGTVYLNNSYLKRTDIGIVYGSESTTCSTGASTAIKRITSVSPELPIDSINNTYKVGTRFICKFLNANTAENPTLQVGSIPSNNNGFPIYDYTGSKITDGDNKYSLSGICEFVFQHEIIDNQDVYYWLLLNKLLEIRDNGNYILTSRPEAVLGNVFIGGPDVEFLPSTTVKLNGYTKTSGHVSLQGTTNVSGDFRTDVFKSRDLANGQAEYTGGEINIQGSTIKIGNEVATGIASYLPPTVSIGCNESSPTTSASVYILGFKFSVSSNGNILTIS